MAGVDGRRERLDRNISVGWEMAIKSCSLRCEGARVWDECHLVRLNSDQMQTDMYRSKRGCCAIAEDEDATEIG